MKKIIALLASVLIAVNILPCCVSAESGGHVYDPSDLLMDIDTLSIEMVIEDVEEETGLEIGVALVDDIGEDKSEEALERFVDSLEENEFSLGEDSVLYVINLDTLSHRIRTSGKGSEIYGPEQCDALILANYYNIDNKDYYYAAYMFAGNVKSNYTLATGGSTSDTGIPYTPQYIFDDANLFSSSEIEELNDLFEGLSTLTGWNVAVVTTNDIGENKSDYAVTDYADVYYEEKFGRDTDGILYLINNDTKYDWISTSGECISYFTDRRIDDLFDFFWDEMVEGEYSLAMKLFAARVQYYYNAGIPYGQYTEDEYYYDDDGEIVFMGDNFIDAAFFMIAEMLPVFVSLLFIGGTIVLIVYKCILSGYKLKSKVSAIPYIAPGTVDISTKTDVFIREYTTRTRVSSSSSGGGRSGGRSSSHRSSGGGRHGGGGRRR